MNLDPLISALINQGGFAVLAAVFGYLGFRGSQMWVADVKSAAERERLLYQAAAEREQSLTKEIFAALARSSESNSSLASAITLLTSEVQGFRAAQHQMLNKITAFEARTYEHDVAIKGLQKTD